MLLWWTIHDDDDDDDYDEDDLNDREQFQQTSFSPTLFRLIPSSQIDPKYEIPRGDLVLEVSSLNDISQKLEIYFTTWCRSSLKILSKKIELHNMMQDTLGEGEFGKVVLASLNNFKGKPGESVKFDFLDFYML